MFIKNWKKEVLTIPNFLSVFRIVLIPVYVYLYLTAKVTSDYIASGIVLAVSCLTDLIDGRIARKYNMVSTIGIVLDPVADKATQVSVIICLSLHHPVLYLVLLLFLIKESFQLIAGIIAYRNGKMLTGALFVGKICTTVLFVSLIAMVLFPEIPDSVIKLIAITDICFLTASFVGYICAYYGKNKKTKDLQP